MRDIFTPLSPSFQSYIDFQLQDIKHALFKYSQLCFYYSINYYERKLVTTILIFSSSSAQWNRKADAFKTRLEVVGVVYKSKLYTFFGFSNFNLHTKPSLEVYDPATNTRSFLLLYG